MEKKFLTIFVLALLAMSVIPVMAWGGSTKVKMKLVQKDPTTWNPVPGGMEGDLLMMFKKRVWFKSRNLQPRTEYTLIYYGYDGHNDEWPWATCIKSGKSDFGGRIQLFNKNFWYQDFIDDGINQKIWLVKSSDVDCVIHKMTAWNPTEYLFEWNTI